MSKYKNKKLIYCKVIQCKQHCILRHNTKGKIKMTSLNRKICFMAAQVKPKNSGMPKTERPITEQLRNLNVFVFEQI